MDAFIIFIVIFIVGWIIVPWMDTIRGKRSIGTRGIFAEVKLSGILILWDVRRNYKSGYND